MEVGASHINILISHLASFVSSYQANKAAMGPHAAHPGDMHVDDEEFAATFILLPYLCLWAPFLLVCLCYFNRWIKPNEEMRLKPSSGVPMSMWGRWSVGPCDCFQECPLCCFIVCFPLCSEAETWYRAGFSHTLIGGQDNCKTYYGGCCLLCLGHQCLQCCWCCIAGAIRGGFTQDPRGISGLIPHEMRFGIQDSNYVVNCLLWCVPCTMMCTLIQEYRQYQNLIKHPEFQMANGMHPQMQMANIGMGMNPNPQFGQPGQVVMAPAVTPMQPAQANGMHPQYVQQGQVVMAPGVTPMQPAQVAPGQMMGQPMMPGQQPVMGQPMQPGMAPPMQHGMAPPMSPMMQGQAMMAPGFGAPPGQ